MTQSNRIIGIDILKCLAAILITNSHMDLLYAHGKGLATGGAIGDALFFFCSGFTLFMKPINMDFANWYKRRINRIYPTVFAIAIIKCLFAGVDSNIIDILLKGGGWFVSCIMIYYAVMYLIGTKYIKNYSGGGRICIIITAIVTIVWFAIMERPAGFNMYKSANTLSGIYDPGEGGYLKWMVYFLYMLLGADIGMRYDKIKTNVAKDGILFLISVMAFYGLYIVPRKIYVLEFLQVFSMIPLFSTTYYLYKLSMAEKIVKWASQPKVYFAIRFIGGLCLEIYLVQFMFFTDKLNGIFPLNLLIVFGAIVVAAYLARCLSRIFAQTFKTDNYDWKAVFQWL